MRKLFVALAVLAVSGCATSQKAKMSSEEKARLYVQIANSSLNQGDPTGALQALVAAERVDADLPELHHTRALALYEKHDLSAALLEARKATELAPEYSDAQNTLGKLLMDSGDSAAAIAPLKKAASDVLYRESYKPLTNLGVLYYRKGDLDRAETYFRRAVEASSVLACVAEYYLGNIDMKRSKFNEAVRDYDRATQKFCAGFADAQLALGIAYERSHQFDRARRKFIQVQDSYPNTSVADEAVAHLRFLP